MIKRLKTQQKFTYEYQTGKPAVYLLMPDEYEQCLNRMRLFGHSLKEVASWVGLETNKVKMKTLKLTQSIIDY